MSVKIDWVRFQFKSGSSSGISRSGIPSIPFVSKISLGTLTDVRLLVNLPTQLALCRSLTVERAVFEVRVEVSWRRIGRRIGMHWTMIVPVISDEYL